MFFVVSKLLEAVFQPATFLILLGLVGLCLTLTRWRRLGSGLAATAVLLLAFVCISPVGSILLRPLEDRFPSPNLEGGVPAGIIVLGGSVDADLSAARGQPALNEAAGRLTAGVELARRFPSARLVFTGGSADIRQNALDEAGAVRKLWLGLGIPAERMVFEDASRNTFENATMTRALVEPKPGETWLLVTSAAHMPRSVGIFRRVGWPVVSFPVDFRTYGDKRDFKPTLGTLEALQKVTTALHEWIGLVAYRATGKTDALFPAP